MKKKGIQFGYQDNNSGKFPPNMNTFATNNNDKKKEKGKEI